MTEVRPKKYQVPGTIFWRWKSKKRRARRVELVLSVEKRHECGSLGVSTKHLLLMGSGMQLVRLMIICVVLVCFRRLRDNPLFGSEVLLRSFDIIYDNTNYKSMETITI